MCLALPGKVVKIQGEKALVAYGKRKKSVDISLLKKIKVGDFVLISGKVAWKKVPLKEVKNILSFFEKEVNL